MLSIKTYLFLLRSFAIFNNKFTISNIKDLKTSRYKSEIIKNLFFFNKLTPGELSEKMGKSVPLITKMILALQNEGYVQEIGLADSTGGRRPVMYALKPNLLYIVSVAVDQLYTRIAIVDIANCELIVKDGKTS